jgi:hypothetical protein
MLRPSHYHSEMALAGWIDGELESRRRLGAAKAKYCRRLLILCPRIMLSVPTAEQEHPPGTDKYSRGTDNAREFPKYAS